ncbi:MAG: AAC(3) family N-acetyltransferase [Candidatus Lokiarchaeota archaeon]|nr:AAC(3) family N-acetyltransferase [Candidatus Lokiarchaeota archaeon]
MEAEYNKRSEKQVVKSTRYPNTITTLKRDFKTLGVRPGIVLIAHSSLSKIGWTVGGPVAVINALMQILTSEGTLVMPTFSSDNTDPSHWENPPVPESWWNTIRNEMPAYHPDITPTRGMGSIVETFRKWPNIIRSNHPTSSFTAWGKYAEIITKNHELLADLGEDSPLARIYELDGYILLLGVSYENNTSLHLAEYRSDYFKKRYKLNGSAILVDNERQWAEWEELDLNMDDFEQLGKDFESKINYVPVKVGIADARLLSQRELVDFAIEWFKENRTAM